MADGAILLLFAGCNTMNHDGAAEPQLLRHGCPGPSEQWYSIRTFVVGIVFFSVLGRELFCRWAGDVVLVM